MTRARDLGDFIADGGTPELVVDTTTLVVDSSNNRVGIGTASPATALDVVGNATITITDNSNALSLVSTDADADIGPVLEFNRNSSSPSVNDQLGRIDVVGKNDAGQDVDYVRIVNMIKDASDGSEDGRLAINTITDGALFSRLNIEPTETVFNDESYDVDFRIETNAQANAFVIDGANDTITMTNQVVTITHGGNGKQLELVSTDADGSSGPQLDLYRNSASPADNDQTGRIVFAAENDADEKIEYVKIITYAPDVSDSSEDGAIQYYVMKDGTSIQRLEHNPTETVFNQDSADVDFRVESDSNASMLFVEGGTDRVAIGHNSPKAKLDIMGQGTSATNLSMLIGADEGGTANPSRSDATDKAVRIGMPHRTNAEEPAALITASSTSSDNTVMIGGGTSVMNAATNIRFITGANTTTTSGSERFRIGSSGELGIGGATYGTSGQVLTSGGSGAAPTWADAASGGTAFSAF